LDPELGHEQKSRPEQGVPPDCHAPGELIELGGSTIMKSKQALAAITVAATLVFTCCSDRKQSQAPTSTSSQQPSNTQRFAGREFAVPPGWTTEQAAGGLLLMAPHPEGGWQANVFLESRQDQENRSLEQALADISPNLKARKQQFIELSRRIDKNPNGIQYGLLEYSCTDQGTGLREWEVVIELANSKRLFVLASSSASLWDKYQPLFKSLLDSLH
jgi:hypothetical protein